MRAKVLRRLMACAVVAVGTASAWAQDYTVTTATGQLEARPAGATQSSISANTVGIPQVATVQLPFAFPYYGEQVQAITVSCGGYVLPRSVASIMNTMSNASAHGQDASSGAFPYTHTGSAGPENTDGLLVALWDALRVNDSFSPTSKVYTWTTGTAPTRHFVVSWDSVRVNIANSIAITLQIQLFETTGRIVFAYSPTGTYPTSLSGGYVCGIDSPNDSRFIAPLAQGNTNLGYPGSDFIFDPRTVTYTGKLLYDKLVSDSSGIGNAVLSNQPLAGCPLELRDFGTVVAARVTTASDGSYTITGVGVPTSTGSLALLAQNSACRVSTNGIAATTEWTVNGSLSLASSSVLGTLSLGTSNDASGSLRSAFNIAASVKAARDWAVSRTTDTIAPLEGQFDDASNVTTTYIPQSGSVPASLRIAGASSGNTDAWDDAIVTKTYARHVLASIAALPASAADYRFDAVSEPQNAFAEAFGYYFWAAVSGTSTAVDGKNATPATVYDLETPTITVTKGQDVAGCMAGALYDLLDTNNETIDTVDGTSTQARVFQLVDAFTVAPTQSTFLQAWGNAGYDAAAITRTFIGNHVLVDDALEPNDDRNESPSLGTAGFVHPGLLLNRFNEDWFSVTLLSETTSLGADTVYDGANITATVGLEIRDAGGALLATGTPRPTQGVLHAATGAVPAGTYKVGVRHLGGATIPTYSLQSYAALAIDPAPVKDWTVGQEFDQSLGIVGGVAPYTASATGNAPTGLFFSPLNQHLVGTPLNAGVFQFTTQVTDAGNPTNTLLRAENVTIHEVLALAMSDFIGFPLGKSVDTTLPTTGGTPPFTITVPTGGLPGSLAFDANSLHVTGLATAAPSSALELDGVDVAGSSSHIATRAVIANPSSGKNVPADLVAGTDACGWWFDAVEGSTVSFTATTAKKRVKRTLSGVVLAPDRSVVLTGKIKPKLGSLTGSKIVCPQSGRYYVIASSDSGDATQLLGNVHVAAPKGGSVKPVLFDPADTTTIEVGALPGATLTLKFVGDKKAGLVAKVVSVTDPTGTQVGFATSIKASATGGTLTMPLPVGGTWTIVLGATSSNGTPGKLSSSFTVKAPKGATYSAD